jgi:carbon storage regulator
MLVLSRRVGEEIVIDGSIRVVIVAVQGNKVRIGVEAPADVPVDRLEIHQRRPASEPLNNNRLPRSAQKSL